MQILTVKLIKPWIYVGVYLLIVLMTSCLSPRQFDLAMSDKNQQLAEARDSIALQSGEIAKLNESLAKARGGNEMLLITHQQQMDRLIELDDEIERLSGSRNDLSLNSKRLEEEKRAMAAQISALKSQYRGVVLEYQNKLSEITERIALDSVLRSSGALRSRAGSVSLHVQEDVLFRRDSKKAAPTSSPILAAIAAILDKNPLLSIEVIGHVDNQGSYANQGGSRAYTAARAAVLSEEFSQKHYISANRIAAVGMGAAEPLESNATEPGRVLNRRMEFRFTNSVVNLLRELDRVDQGN